MRTKGNDQKIRKTRNQKIRVKQNFRKWWDATISTAPAMIGILKMSVLGRKKTILKTMRNIFVKFLFSDIFGPV